MGNDWEPFAVRLENRALCSRRRLPCWNKSDTVPSIVCVPQFLHLDDFRRGQAIQWRVGTSANPRFQSFETASGKRYRRAG